MQLISFQASTMMTRTIIQSSIATLLVAAIAPAVAAQTVPVDPAVPDSSVLELRQYKIVPGQRDAFVELFERYFVESQDAVGMSLLGQFRDLDDPDRFTWLRQFPNMPARKASLEAFYYGPVWKAHREQANPMLDDNDNVLLLHPALPDLTLGPVDPRTRMGEPPTKPGVVIATIYYLWKDPSEGFTQFFASKLKPALAAAGLPVLGGYVAETATNTFPRLPVRQGEKVFVWFTRVADQVQYEHAQAELKESAVWTGGLGTALAAFEERQPQVLRLAPTPRSALR